MNHPEIERAARLLDTDQALREELWSITEPGHFVATLVRRAGERGIVLVDGEVWEAYHDGRLCWLRAQAS